MQPASGPRNHEFMQTAQLLRRKIKDAMSTTYGNSTLLLKEIVVTLKKYERDIEQLYVTAGIRDIDVAEVSRVFRGNVLSEAGDRVCLKIFATLLLVQIELGDAWFYFLVALSGARPCEQPVPSPVIITCQQLCHVPLPLPLQYIQDKFGHKDADAFYEQQYLFCPVDFDSRFDKVRTSLRNIIATSTEPSIGGIIECVRLNQAGSKDELEPEDRFCPDEVPDELVAKRGALIEQLHVEACKAQHILQPLEPLSSRWKFIHQAEQEAEQFLSGVKLRPKLLAILVFMDVPALSSTWERFTDICLERASKIGKDVSEYQDELLPMAYKSIETHFGRDHQDAFWFTQQLFCTAKLRRKTQVVTIGPEQYQRLPLLEKQPIGAGSFGTVYRIRLKGGCLGQKDEELAMKVMQTTGRNSDEWGSAKWLFEQPFSPHKSIMKALASYQTPKSIHIFFPLATCNLRQYMTGNQKFCCSEGPRDYCHRKEKLNPMIGIVEALTYLHTGLQDEKRRTPMILIHGDLKAENILVTAHDNDKLLFQITDFGISSIKHTTEAAVTINRNSMFQERYRSLREMPTETILGHNLPNFAPEAHNNGDINSKVDIWAFGTVYAEYVAWLSGGISALKDFEDSRGGGVENKHSDDFLLSFKMEVVGKDTRPIVKPGIVTWFTNLLERTTEPLDLGLYQSSWALLEQTLLMCDRVKRANIEDVNDYMYNIFHGRPVFQTVSRPSQPAGALALTPSQTLSLQPIPEIASRPPNGTQPLTALDETQNREVERTQANNRDRVNVAASADAAISTDEVVTTTKNTRTERTQLIATTLATPGPIQSNQSVSHNDEQRDSRGRTSLLRKIAHGRADSAFRLLNKNVNVDVSDSTGWTSLHYAVLLPNVLLVKRLLQVSPSLALREDHEGCTALHLCAKQGNLEYANLLLDLEKPYNTGPNVQDCNGRTPIYYATDQNPSLERRQMVELLLSKGAEVMGRKVGAYAYRYPSMAGVKPKPVSKKRRWF